MAAAYLNDLEYLEDDFNGMFDFDNLADDGFGFDMHDHLHEDLHAEIVDYFDNPDRQQNDTSATEYRNGKDMQGIPWERLNRRRDDFRTTRLNRYQNFESLSIPRDNLKKELKKVQRQNTFYDFQFNTRLAKTTIVHFQLRNLLWATSKHDVYMVYNYSIMHWSPLLKECHELLNVSGPVVPTQKSSGACNLNRVQICAMAVKDDFLAAGGFRGELICKYLNKPGAIFCTKLTEDDNAITNSVDIAQSPSGAGRVICGNNDSFVRVLDTDKFSLLNRFPFPWSVNSTSVSPDGKLLAVLGDSPDCLTADPQSGKVVSTLKGHLDYSFSCAWHPAGHILATGNQDTTCRLWDVRYSSESLAVLKGNMGAIRGIKFSSDGNFMAMTEAADYVHVYDTKAEYSAAQEMDLFGEISGISFSPDCESLFVGIADRTYGSLIEFKRRHQHSYLDSYF
ncbi:putative WD repeat-containing protein C2A9.03 isoform X1 [Carex rostrata]